MSEPIVIPLDQGPTTEPGWYFCAVGGSLAAARLFLKHPDSGKLGIADEHKGTVTWIESFDSETRWSRRIKVQAAG